MARPKAALVVTKVDRQVLDSRAPSGQRRVCRIPCLILCLAYVERKNRQGVARGSVPRLQVDRVLGPCARGVCGRPSSS